MSDILYEEQLSAAKFRAERDQARQELDRLRDRLRDTTMNACDLLPEEDREALRWVRERGGLDYVKSEWRSRVPHDRYEARRQRLLGHIAECETALGRRRVRIEELGHRVSDLTNENAELLRRVSVLAADGEPLEVGQTVWGVDDGREWTVSEIINGTVSLSNEDGIFHEYSAAWVPSEQLTHQRPVLDADGVPIREGDTVWKEGTVLAIPMTVVEVSRDTVRCEYAWTDGKVYRPCCSPDTLTHTKPEPIDTWQRIEEDALNFVEDNTGMPHDQDQMERDMLSILRRCKALAERERGE